MRKLSCQFHGNMHAFADMETENNSIEKLKMLGIEAHKHKRNLICAYVERWAYTEPHKWFAKRVTRKIEKRSNSVELMRHKPFSSVHKRKYNNDFSEP